MTIDMVLLSGIILIATALFALDLFPPDKVGILVLGMLILAGLIDPQQAISGFGNEATVTVACMLALSFGVQRTGGLNYAAKRIVAMAGASEVRVMLAIMLAVGGLSAFINNTAAVALFLPLTISVCRQQGLDVSKVLMPMSFAAIFAGTCTLIGTSTNLLVASIVRDQKQWQIGMFEFSSMGLIFFAAGMLYMTTAGSRLIPSRRAGESLTEDYRLRQFVTNLKVEQGSPLIGKLLSEARLGEEYGIDVIEILRGKAHLLTTSRQARIQQGDDLLVSADPRSLIRLQREQGLTLKALQVEDRILEDENVLLVEAWIAPNSSLVESTLKEINFRQVFKSTALAIRSHGRTIREKIGNFRLEYGDSLLILTSTDRLDFLRRSPDFLVLEEMTETVASKSKVYWALGIFAAVVALAASGLTSVLEAAIMGLAAMVLAGVVRLHDLYANISWQTIIMLGCLIPLGAAMTNTGLAAKVAEELVGVLRDWGPTAVLSGVYLLTTILTSIMSNNATAILMVPICFSVADQLDVDYKPFVFAVMFASSACFMTPVGYQTNLFIFGPGGYKFSDFLRAGTPLNLIFWILASIFIPILWPF